jgi:hypothetical protein
MALPYIPSLDDYGDAPLRLDKCMHRNRQNRVRQHEGEIGQWAPFAGNRRSACKDVNGRLRHKHDYVVEGRRGLECVWCRRVAPDRLQAG